MECFSPPALVRIVLLFQVVMTLGFTESEHPASTVDEVHGVAAVVHPSGTEITPVLLQAEPTWDP